MEWALPDMPYITQRGKAWAVSDCVMITLLLIITNTDNSKNPEPKMDITKPHSFTLVSIGFFIIINLDIAKKNNIQIDIMFENKEILEMALQRKPCLQEMSYAIYVSP